MPKMEDNFKAYFTEPDPCGRIIVGEEDMVGKCFFCKEEESSVVSNSRGSWMGGCQVAKNEATAVTSLLRFRPRAGGPAYSKFKRIFKIQKNLLVLSFTIFFFM